MLKKGSGENAHYIGDSAPSLTTYYNGCDAIALPVTSCFYLEIHMQTTHSLVSLNVHGFISVLRFCASVKAMQLVLVFS